MALYQSRRNLWDCSNSLDIPTGTYVETDCVKWIARFGSDFRKLGVDEAPIPGIAVLTVTKTVEDLVEPVKSPTRKFIPPSLDNKAAVATLDAKSLDSVVLENDSAAVTAEKI